ncbi:hypothetical protein Enr13x_37500 [Stieleria neptunia]|uniref:Uncharacterized protein n=1 Tax=Stieleria neptunia TaxID=2527979 RepID=A0A518HSR1_9BACT|nr:hypothetical protein [Stieleria neptunia]QDV43890.1 hypothetical protein Enr13x_37500 [Stieleria neptunia]
MNKRGASSWQAFAASEPNELSRPKTVEIQPFSDHGKTSEARGRQETIGVLKSIITRLCMTALLIGLVLGANADAQVPSALSSRDYLMGALSGVLDRAFTLQASEMGTYHDDSNWGKRASHYVDVVKGIGTEPYWIRVGPLKTLGYRPKPIYHRVPHSMWSRGWVRAEIPRRNIDVDLYNLRVGPRFIEVDVRVKATLRGEAHVKQYSHGVQLLDVTAHGRADAFLNFTMRLTLAPSGFSVSAEVKNLTLKHDNFVVDRVGYFGGTTAKLLGDALLETTNRVKPELMRDAYRDAKKSIIKALTSGIFDANRVADLILDSAKSKVDPGLFPNVSYDSQSTSR